MFVVATRQSVWSFSALCLLGTTITTLMLPLQAQVVAGPILPATPYSYTNIQFPQHFSILFPIDTTQGRPSTDAGVTLGRVLFYDKNLSKNRTVACGSCHVQANGFSDPRRFSVGFEGGLGTRQSPALSNSRFNATGKVFWDERANSLEDQALRPIQDAVEMGLTLTELEQRVAALSYYPPLFKAAFGDTTINSDRIARAIAQFDRALVSFRSRYDVGRAQVANPQLPFPNFTAEENRGKQIFILPRPGGGGCAGCHATDAFLLEPGPVNIGLDVASADPGVFGITGNLGERGAFRVGSLRNIAVSAPYMHDGRFASLGDVVDFYDHEVKNAANLDPRLKTPQNQPAQLDLSQADKAAVVAFLNTLTDTEFLTDARLGDPFRALRNVSAASQASVASPNSIATGFGLNLALSTISGPTPLPTTLGGVQVLVRDSNRVERAAGLYYVSGGQLNYLIPADTATGLANITVVRNGSVVSLGTLDIAAVAPAIFTANGDGSGAPAAYAVTADLAGKVVATPTFRSTGPPYLPATIGLSGNDVVLELYGTGIRSGARVTATIGGASAEVVYFGAHTIYPGLDQINVKVPKSVAGRGTVPLVLTVDGNPSNAVDLAF